MLGRPEVGGGLVGGGGGLFRLPRRIPYHLAMEIALTGARGPAQRLDAAGLINRLVPAGEALAQARALAPQPRRNAPLSLAATNRIVAHAAARPPPGSFRRQTAPIPPAF